MRLLLLNQFFAPDVSPTAKLASALAERRSCRGDEVTVLTSRGQYASSDGSSNSRLSHELILGIGVHRIWSPNLGKGTVFRRCADYGAFYLGAAVRVLTLPRQDVVISLTTPPYIAWVAVLHKLKNRHAKVLLWNMDCYPEVAERVGKLEPGGVVATVMRRMNRALFRRVDHVVCLDRAMHRLLMSQYAASSHEPRSSIIPNWERLAQFPAGLQTERWPGYAQHDLAGKLVVLYLGNMGEGHEFETALEAAERLRNEPVVFLFIGEGRRKSEIEEATRHRQLTNVLVRGHLPESELKSAMASAHCALITLRTDCLGVMSPSKLHLSLAMSLPIIFVGPRGGNVDEAIERFECGVSLRTGDVEGMVAFIRSGLENRGLFEQLRARARLAFETAYCDTQTLPQFDAVFTALLARGESERSKPLPASQSNFERVDRTCMTSESAAGPH